VSQSGHLAHRIGEPTPSSREGVSTFGWSECVCEGSSRCCPRLSSSSSSPFVCPKDRIGSLTIERERTKCSLALQQSPTVSWGAQVSGGWDAIARCHNNRVGNEDGPEVFRSLMKGLMSDEGRDVVSFFPVSTGTSAGRWMGVIMTYASTAERICGRSFVLRTRVVGYK
jgi:hypothetical protein